MTEFYIKGFDFFNSAGSVYSNFVKKYIKIMAK